MFPFMHHQWQFLNFIPIKNIVKTYFFFHKIDEIAIDIKGVLIPEGTIIKNMNQINLGSFMGEKRRKETHFIL